MMNQTNIPYEYKNAPVPGGGFVTGFVFHPKEPGVLYARTDIGGVYRREGERWVSLIDGVTALDKCQCYPLSLALDPADPNVLAIACGDGTQGRLCISRDRGETFVSRPIPAPIHGNAPGRGTGERLHFAPDGSGMLWFGSQTGGLFRSSDLGESWEKIPVTGPLGKEETNFAFLWLDPRPGSRNIVAACSGQDNTPDGRTRGPSLYFSPDGGERFTLLPGQPQPSSWGTYPGYVGQRAAFDGQYLYVTVACVEVSWAGWSGYACDMGGAQCGEILRYRIAPEGSIQEAKTITPDLSGIGEGGTTGFGGICAIPGKPGAVICSTQGRKTGEAVIYTEDRGQHWRPILFDLEIGQMEFNVPYMRPECNGGKNLIHWLSDLKVDPFDTDRAYFNTGTGIFSSKNLSAASVGGTVVWQSDCAGVEETVHLNVYSPPSGEVRLIDIIGDLGGFAFTDLDTPPGNSFADAEGNRYITCMNADFPDDNASLVVVAARGNWTGKTTGGVILSRDQCRTWDLLPHPWGLSSEIDLLLREIIKPNVNPGWVAISADSRTIVWTVGDGRDLPAYGVVYTEDEGKHWHKSLVLEESGAPLTEPSETLKVMSDRADPELFYGFGEDSKLYVSTDRARTFRRLPAPEGLPKMGLGGMDGRVPAEIRVDSGSIWISMAEGGLWRLQYDREQDRFSGDRITPPGDCVFRHGLGKPAPGMSCKTHFMNGVLGGEYGFWRSDDGCSTWNRINNEKQMYGDIRSICGDPRTFGRFYIASGSRGVLYGQPAETKL